MNPPLQEKNDIRKPMNLLRVELKCVKREKTQCRPIHFPFRFRYCEKGVKNKLQSLLQHCHFIKNLPLCQTHFKRNFSKMVKKGDFLTN